MKKKYSVEKPLVRAFINPIEKYFKLNGRRCIIFLRLLVEIVRLVLVVQSISSSFYFLAHSVCGCLCMTCSITRYNFITYRVWSKWVKDTSQNFTSLAVKKQHSDLQQWKHKQPIWIQNCQLNRQNILSQTLFFFKCQHPKWLFQTQYRHEWEQRSIL